MANTRNETDERKGYNNSEGVKERRRALSGEDGVAGMGQDETLISRGGNIGPMIFEARVL